MPEPAGQRTPGAVAVGSPEHVEPLAGGQGGLRVEVCHVAAARPGQPALQFLKTFRLLPGATLHQAISQSGVLEADTSIDLSRCKVGIHGKVRDLDTLLRDGDRVEIYRPLQVDPMAARRRRASVRG